MRGHYRHTAGAYVGGTAGSHPVKSEVMLKEIASVTQVYLVTGYTDLRLGNGRHRTGDDP